MARIQITAGQICFDDEVIGKGEVFDFDIYNESVSIEFFKNGAYRQEWFGRFDTLTVETEYLERDPDNGLTIPDSEDVEISEQEFSEDIGDLLDH